MTETVELTLLDEIKRLRPHYQSNSMLDVGRRQLLDHFEQFVLTRSDPAVRDRVKPLEWGKTSYGTPEAISVVGVYRINSAMNGGCTVVFGGLRGCALSGPDGRTNFADEDAAKIAAQADYERRILSALEPRTAPPEPASGWMPIESAPKDWSDVLIHVPGFDDHRDVAEAYFNPESGVWKSHASRRKLHPTHWQTLPAPPAKEPQ